MTQVAFDVTDTSGHPISGATITLSPNGSIATTGKNGNAVMQVQPGSGREVTVVHKNYATVTETVTIPENSITMHVKMQPAT